MAGVGMLHKQMAELMAEPPARREQTVLRALPSSSAPLGAAGPQPMLRYDAVASATRAVAGITILCAIGGALSTSSTQSWSTTPRTRLHNEDLAGSQ